MRKSTFLFLPLCLLPFLACSTSVSGEGQGSGSGSDGDGGDGDGSIDGSGGEGAGDGDSSSGGEGSGGTSSSGGSSSGGSGSTETAPTDAPNLVTPVNNTYKGSIHLMGSSRPHFSWTEVTGDGTISYELDISDDGTFSTGTTTETVDGTEFTPSADLPASKTAPVGTRFYWRVRACNESGCGPYSDARWVNVGSLRKDVDGDGYADVIVSEPQYDNWGGRLQVIKGGGTFNTTVDYSVLPTEADYRHGLSVAAMDLNGDGYSDLVAGSVGLNERGVVEFHFGSDAGPRGNVMLPTIAFNGAPEYNQSNAEFGWSVDSAGDLNADGYQDVIVGQGGGPYEPPPTMPGHAYVYLGASGFNAATYIYLSGGTDNDRFASAVAGAGDLNADGYDDLIIGARLAGTGGRAYIYFGGPSGPDTVADGILEVSGGVEFGTVVASAGDHNCDGYGDVIVGDPEASKAYLFLGGPGDSFDNKSDQTFTGTRAFGASVGTAGDLDDDGCSELLIANPDDTNRGFVKLYAGAPQTDAIEEATLDHGIKDSAYGGSIGLPEDIDGDGHDDLVISHYYHPIDWGKFQVEVLTMDGDFTPSNNIPITTTATGKWGWSVK